MGIWSRSVRIFKGTLLHFGFCTKILNFAYDFLGNAIWAMGIEEMDPPTFRFSVHIHFKFGWYAPTSMETKSMKF